MIGRGCFLNRETMLAAHELIEIGDHIDVRQPLLRRRRRPPLRRSRPADHLAGLQAARAGADRLNVWLGKGVVVQGGITIGDRCVVGSNSVVTKDLPRGERSRPASPAKVLREIEFTQRGRWVACGA